VGWNAGGAGTACAFDNPGSPPCDYNIPGRYPAVAEGVVEMTVCFHEDSRPCVAAVEVGVVNCVDFLLWRLPYVPYNCDKAYCTAPSGL
jgi:hypothetical protein